MAAADPEPGLPLVAAVALRRGDGRVLLVRHAEAARTGAAGGRWTLPAEPVADDEVVEQALARLLRERLHLASKSTEFSESIGLPGAIANVFTCTEWAGEPQYAAADYADAAWAAPHAPGGVDLAEGVRDWLAGAFPAPEPPPRQAATLQRSKTAAAPTARPTPAKPVSKGATTAEEVVAELEGARAELLEAYAKLDEAWRDVSLDGGWAPVDLLAHCATLEAYYASEARRLIEEPGHTWREFNADQGAAERAGRARPADRAERARLEAVRAETLAWVEGLAPDDLAAYGNHAERGAVRVGERLEGIARHDRAHAEQLAKMLAATEDDPDDQDVGEAD
jgi:ADP-ribose pyrophosphatase YjhB (NUDIX family)